MFLGLKYNCILIIKYLFISELLEQLPLGRHVDRVLPRPHPLPADHRLPSDYVHPQEPGSRLKPF
jgi:hypothetical protein